MSNSTITAKKTSILPILLSLLIINGLIPYICYTVMKDLHASDVAALGVAAIAPAVEALVGLLRSRRINFISLFVIAGLIVSIILTFLGGDPRLIIVRESFFTGLLGLACFVSLLFPRPLMFLVGRSFLAGNSPQEIARYNQIWQIPQSRRVTRLLTIIWGFIYIADFVLRVIIAFTLTIPQALTVGPIITAILIAGSLLWTLAYVRKTRQQVREARAMSVTNSEAMVSHNSK